MNHEVSFLGCVKGCGTPLMLMFATHETTVEASYMEVYNERVRDLLVPTGRPLK